MEALGLISISKGRNAQAPQFDKGVATSYEAGVRYGSARKHFPQQLPRNVVEVRGKSTTVRGMKTKGKKLKLVHTEKSRAIEADVKSLNSFIVDFELEGESSLAIEGSSVTATWLASTSSEVVVFTVSATTATRPSRRPNVRR